MSLWISFLIHAHSETTSLYHDEDVNVADAEQIKQHLYRVSLIKVQLKKGNTTTIC